MDREYFGIAIYQKLDWHSMKVVKVELFRSFECKHIDLNGYWFSNYAQHQFRPYLRLYLSILYCKNYYQAKIQCIQTEMLRIDCDYYKMVRIMGEWIITSLNASNIFRNRLELRVCCIINLLAIYCPSFVCIFIIHEV